MIAAEPAPSLHGDTEQGWAPRSAEALGGMLTSRRWLRREHPFPHVVAEDVFTTGVHAALEAEFARRLNPSGAGSTASHFGRTLPGYDATAFLFTPSLTGPLRLFLSRGWRDVVAAAAGVEVTDHVSGGLHHHAVGGRPGRIHTDLNPAWFVEYDGPDGIVVADHAAVRYGTGEPRRSGVEPRPFVRAVAVLYYLANLPWHPGDGGVTGLYACSDADLAAPAAIVPPVNNSLVAFECTPNSCHAFLTNHRHPRNCVAMWLHRPRSAVVAKWGEDALENDGR